MALQGSLSELSLPDVIQMVSVSGKTGVFEVTRSDEIGRIYLSDGRIVDAVVGALRGDNAVYEMVIWSEGDFSFKQGVEPEAVTIKLSNANLMEAAPPTGRVAGAFAQDSLPRQNPLLHLTRSIRSGDLESP
jgi:hypothetical protein